MSKDPNPVVTHSKRAKFEDVGSARKLYADAQASVFCSAVLSRSTITPPLAYTLPPKTLPCMWPR